VSSDQFYPKRRELRSQNFDSNNSVTVSRIASLLTEDRTMLFLVISVVSLAIGFVLGRVWEIRQDIKQQTASDSARIPSAPSDRHAALADRLATPRDLFASHNRSQMGF
jgi:hypothetical protein